MIMYKRRKFIYQATGLISSPFLTQILGCSSTKIVSKPLLKKVIGSVVIVGGGFAGATAAKYLQQWGEGLIRVVIIEKNDFASIPLSESFYIKGSMESGKRQ